MKNHLFPFSFLAAVDVDGDGVFIRTNDPLHIVLLERGVEVCEPIGPFCKGDGSLRPLLNQKGNKDICYYNLRK